MFSYFNQFVQRSVGHVIRLAMWSDWSYCSTVATFNYLTRWILESRTYHMTSYSYVFIPGSQRGRDKPSFHSVNFQNNNPTTTPTHGSSGSELRVGVLQITPELSCTNINLFTFQLLPPLALLRWKEAISNWEAVGSMHCKGFNMYKQNS